MNGPEETQLHDLGWMAAPAWMLFSAMEILGVVIAEQKPVQGNYLHHLIDVSPGLVAAAIGVLHWWSIREYRTQKLENELKIAQLQARRSPEQSRSCQSNNHFEV